MLRRFQQFSFTVAGICRFIQQIERDEMVKYGLKGTYTPYLVMMERYPEGITAARLSELCDKDKAAVSRAVAQMEGQGLLIRKGMGAYRAKLMLTSEGHAAAQYVCEKVKVAVELAGEGLENKDREVFYKALGLIAANLQRISEQGLPDEREAASLLENETEKEKQE